MDPRDLPAIGDAVMQRLEALERDRVLERIWAHDHTVWKDDPTEISDRLGWLDLPDTMPRVIPELSRFAGEALEDGLEAAVLLGMGGSSLAPEVLMNVFGARGGLELRVLDTTHPATVARATEEIDPDRTLFVVASKSGTTTETLSHLAHFWSLVPKGERFVAITDAGTPLQDLAEERGFRAVFANPADIGGRYSALSLFGLLPGALIGAPLEALLGSAEAVRAGSSPSAALADNGAAVLGVAMGVAAREGRDKLTTTFPPALANVGDWVEQLVAESTGKEGVGIVPVVGEPVGPPAVYDDDRLFVASDPTGALHDVEVAGHPVLWLGETGPEGLGGEFFRWELATAIAGHVLGINPFDQPNVQEAKDATTTILSEGDAVDEPFADVAALLDDVGAGDYVAIMAYLDRTPDTDAAVQAARVAIRDRHRVATTVGFGPRFLHSTGQLHKGGAGNGVFVQVVDDGRDADVPIPGQSYSFGTLIDAQALGDLRALRAKGRRVARVRLADLMEVTSA